MNCRKIVIVYRDTLAEKVPCLHFLSQASRRECISVSQSESSLRDSMLSRRSSGCKTVFHRVMSMSTTDTVSLGSLCSDVNIGQRCSLLLSKIILGGFLLTKRLWDKLNSSRGQMVGLMFTDFTDLQHIWSDVELDPVSQSLQSSYSLRTLKDKECNSLATLPEEKGS